MSKLMQYKPYHFSNYYPAKTDTRAAYNKKRANGSWEQARVLLDVMEKEDQEALIYNERAREHNEAVRDDILAQMDALGFERKVWRTKSSRSNKRYFLCALWVEAITAAFDELPFTRAVVNPHVKQHMVNWYAEQRRELDEEEKKEELTRERERQNAEFEEKRRRDEAMTAVLAAKYGLDVLSSPDDVISRIVACDPLLALSHEMHLMRMSWSDWGPKIKRIRNALSFLPDEYPGLDVSAVRDDIMDCIESDTFDGRIFRDTTWNYSALNNVVAAHKPELYADYDALFELVDWS